MVSLTPCARQGECGRTQPHGAAVGFARECRIHLEHMHTASGPVAESVVDDLAFNGYGQIGHANAISTSAAEAWGYRRSQCAANDRERGGATTGSRVAA